MRPIGGYKVAQRGRESVTLWYEKPWWKFWGLPPEKYFELWPTGWREILTGNYASFEERRMIGEVVQYADRNT